MAKLFYGHVRVQDVKIHYYRTGEEKPAVVLLHGFGDSALSWSRLALRLEPDYDVIMIDARGHGLSDGPELGYRPQDQASDVAAIIQELDLVRPALIGHDMGAMTASVVAAGYPDLINSVVLENPCWSVLPDCEFNSPLQVEQVRAELDDLRKLNLQQLQDLCKEKNQLWNAADIFQWAKAHQQIKVNAARFYAEEPPAWREIIARIQIPALLIGGNPELGSLLSGEALELANQHWKKNKQNRVIWFEDAAQCVHRDQFDSYWDEIAFFLARQNWSRKKR